MNKYQEALDKLFYGYQFTANNDVHPDYKTWTSIEYIAGKDKDILQQLVDKETPKKVKKDTESYSYVCSKCNKRIAILTEKEDKLYQHHLITHFNYCRYCGQKLDWSGDK